MESYMSQLNLSFPSTDDVTWFLFVYISFQNSAILYKMHATRKQLS